MTQSIIGALRVVLGIDSAGFDDGLTAAQSRLKKAGADMEKLGGKIAGVGAGLSLAVTGPLVAFGASAAEAANESRAAIGQVESALASMGTASGRTAEQLKASAAGLQSLSTYDDDEILGKVTANLLTFGNVSGDVFDRAQLAAVNLSARLGTDLQSSAIQLGKALNDPVKGITALSRVGVSFTAEQKEQIKAMTEAGNVAGAQNLILAELEKQYGGAAKAARDAKPNADTIDAYSEFQETVGDLVNELLPPLTKFLTDVLNLFNSMSPSMQQIVVVVAAVAAGIGPLLIGFGGLVSAGGGLLTLMVSLGPAFTAVAAIVTGTVLPALAAAGQAILAMLVSTGPIGWLALSVAGIVTVWANWDKIEPIARRLYEGVRTWIQGRLGAVFDWLGKRVEAVGDFFYRLYDRVVGNSYVPDMVEGIGEEIDKLDGLMVDPVGKATLEIGDNFASLANNVTRSIGDIIGSIKSGDLGGALGSVGSLLGAVGSLLGDGGAGSAFSGIGQLLGSFSGLFANGGTIPSGQWGIVGERGPEAIFAGASSVQVQPMGGTQGSHITVGIDPRNGNITAFVNDQIAATAPAIAQAGASIAQGQAAQRQTRRFR